MQTNEAIKLWKELGITNCTMEFSCGGDSMNDTNFTFYKDTKEIKCQELFDYFDNEVYRQVEFYEASDGHYQGEFGEVHIELDEESDDEHSFTYSKSSKSEWSERTENVIGITLTEKETEFINNYVLNINGGDGDVVVNFKVDFIMTDDDETLLEELKDKINKQTQDYSPEDVDGELDDWYSFTTNGDGDTLTIKDNELQVEVSNSYTQIREEDY
jgi:hypothetical protein